MRAKRLFGGLPVLQSDILILRAIKETDFEDLYDLYSNEKVYQYRPGVARKTEEAVQKLILKCNTEYEQKEAAYFAVCMNEEPDTVVAVAEIFGIDSRLEMVNIGYSVREVFWGNGIATEIVRMLLRYLFNEIEVNRVQAHAMPENEPSNKVLQKSGMIKEGLIRQGALWNGKGIVDVNQYAILKKDYKNECEVKL